MQKSNVGNICVICNTFFNTNSRTRQRKTCGKKKCCLVMRANIKKTYQEITGVTRFFLLQQNMPSSREIGYARY